MQIKSAFSFHRLPIHWLTSGDRLHFSHLWVQGVSLSHKINKTLFANYSRKLLCYSTSTRFSSKASWQSETALRLSHYILFKCRFRMWDFLVYVFMVLLTVQKYQILLYTWAKRYRSKTKIKLLSGATNLQDIYKIIGGGQGHLNCEETLVIWPLTRTHHGWFGLNFNDI